MAVQFLPLSDDEIRRVALRYDRCPDVYTHEGQRGVLLHPNWVEFVTSLYPKWEVRFQTCSYLPWLECPVDQANKTVERTSNDEHRNQPAEATADLVKSRKPPETDAARFAVHMLSPIDTRTDVLSKSVAAGRQRLRNNTLEQASTEQEITKLKIKLEGENAPKALWRNYVSRRSIELSQDPRVERVDMFDEALVLAVRPIRVNSSRLDKVHQFGGLRIVIRSSEETGFMPRFLEAFGAPEARKGGYLAPNVTNEGELVAWGETKVVLKDILRSGDLLSAAFFTLDLLSGPVYQPSWYKDHLSQFPVV